MTRTNLKILMAAKGITVSEIAAKLAVTTISIYDVLSGKRSSKRIEAALEAILDMSIPDIRSAWNNNSKPVFTSEIKQVFEKFCEKYGVKAAM